MPQDENETDRALTELVRLTEEAGGYEELRGENHEAGRTIDVSDEELEVLRKLLERNSTARESHGGLKGVLGMWGHDGEVLLGFLDRVVGSK